MMIFKSEGFLRGTNIKVQNCNKDVLQFIKKEIPPDFLNWIFFVALFQTQLRWQKARRPTGPPPLCWQPDWGDWSQPLSASPRAGRSSTSTRFSLSPSSPWCCLLHSARYPPRSTTRSTPRWLQRSNVSKGQTRRMMDGKLTNQEV